jgi:hypothetical protein
VTVTYDQADVRYDEPLVSYDGVDNRVPATPVDTNPPSAFIVGRDDSRPPLHTKSRTRIRFHVSARVTFRAGHTVRARVTTKAAVEHHAATRVRAGSLHARTTHHADHTARAAVKVDAATSHAAASATRTQVGVRSHGVHKTTPARHLARAYLEDLELLELISKL